METQGRSQHQEEHTSLFDKETHECIEFILNIEIVVYYLVDSLVADTEESSQNPANILEKCLIDILQGDDIALTEVSMSLEDQYSVTITDQIIDSWLNCKTIPEIATEILALR